MFTFQLGSIGQRPISSVWFSMALSSHTKSKKWFHISQWRRVCPVVLDRARHCMLKDQRAYGAADGQPLCYQHMDPGWLQGYASRPQNTTANLDRTFKVFAVSTSLTSYIKTL